LKVKYIFMLHFKIFLMLIFLPESNEGIGGVYSVALTLK